MIAIPTCLMYVRSKNSALLGRRETYVQATDEEQTNLFKSITCLFVSTSSGRLMGCIVIPPLPILGRSSWK